ncbi:MAG TPA: septation protein SepH, partial [Agromyces mariniharenae]|nr:septation protein SepH [Agromyces mariniharenae]
SFEPRKHALQPLNSEAITLSQQGELKGGLIPRLRAVAPESDESRFDSGAFTFDEPEFGEHDTAPHLEPLPYARATPATSSPAVTRAAIKRADEPKESMGETADLLEALRRRRGERESAAAEPEQPQLPLPLAPAPAQASEAPKSQPAEAAPEDKPGAAARALWGGGKTSGASNKPANGSNGSQRPAKKGRASMPSWDEIVFGARSDDDLA